MTVVVEGDLVRLAGDCPVEDAEALLQALPGRGIDLAGAGRLHTAVIQVLMALQPPVVAPPADPFTLAWLSGCIGVAESAAGS